MLSETLLCTLRNCSYEVSVWLCVIGTSQHSNVFLHYVLLNEIEKKTYFAFMLEKEKTKMCIGLMATCPRLFLSRQNCLWCHQKMMTSSLGLLELRKDVNKGQNQIQIEEIVADKWFMEAVPCKIGWFFQLLPFWHLVQLIFCCRFLVIIYSIYIWK